MIYKFNRFLILEKLHINIDIDKISSKIYNELINSENKIFIFNDIPQKLHINKIIIKLDIKENIIKGKMNISKSKKLKNGFWNIYIDIFSKDNLLATISHELNHALRLTHIDKDIIINKYNYIRSETFFKKFNDEDINNFFYYIYISNEEEINSSVIETYSIIKEHLNGVKIEDSKYLKYLIQSTPAYINAENMIDFKINKHFKNLSNEQKIYFFYLFDKYKKELDSITSKNIFIKFIKVFNSILSSMKDFKNFKYPNITNIYGVKKDGRYYEKFINSQGNKLKRKLDSLIIHFL